uniref:MFS transporter n=1 Tax=Thermosporothrix sp. COM3 TaxID=2490863 RepID=A0A455SWB9_9CHLR|nr:MFS transporter [Thermosporothrix sp. COM3]
MQVSEHVQEGQETSSVRRLPLYAYYVANTISYVGNRCTFVAIPWFVLETTGSVTQTAITAFFTTLPMVLSAFFGSVFVDRVGSKRTSILSDLLSALTVMCIPLLHLFGILAFWQLLALVFISGLLKAPGETGREMLLPTLVKQAGIRMERATAAADGVSRLSSFLALPLAAALVALIGASNLLWIDAVSFLLSALLIGACVPSVALARRESSEKRGIKGYFADLGSGIAFLKYEPVILTTLATVLITNLLDGGLSTVIAPAYTKYYFHSPVPLGTIFGVMGGAAFVGTIIFGAIGHRLPRRLTFGLCFCIGGGLRFLAMAFVPNMWFLTIAHAFMGLALGPLNPLLSTILYERVPENMRARVFGVLAAGSSIGIPVGELLSGYLVNGVGIQNSLIITGSIYMLVTLSLLVNPKLRAMDRSVEAAV